MGLVSEKFYWQIILFLCSRNKWLKLAKLKLTTTGLCNDFVNRNINDSLGRSPVSIANVKIVAFTFPLPSVYHIMPECLWESSGEQEELLIIIYLSKKFPASPKLMRTERCFYKN